MMRQLDLELDVDLDDHVARGLPRSSLIVQRFHELRRN